VKSEERRVKNPIALPSSFQSYVVNIIIYIRSFTLEVIIIKEGK